MLFVTAVSENCSEAMIQAHVANHRVLIKPETTFVEAGPPTTQHADEVHTDILTPCVCNNSCHIFTQMCCVPKACHYGGSADHSSLLQHVQARAETGYMARAAETKEFRYDGSCCCQTLTQTDDVWLEHSPGALATPESVGLEHTGAAVRAPTVL